MAKHSISHFSISFLLSLCFAYLLIGFLNSVLDSTLAIIIATLIVMTIANILIYLSLQNSVGRVALSEISEGRIETNSQSNPFLLFLPIFFFATIYICLQFPDIFSIEYISIPQKYLLTFIITALITLLWTPMACHWIVQKQTFVLHNKTGIYLGGMFFLIHLILSRALNHPALSHNVVLFEADAGPWMEILASPNSSPINRAVHPLSLIIIRPLMRLISFWMGEHYQLGAMLVVSVTAGLCVFMAYLFIKRATESKVYAFLFATLLGFSASHLLFGSLTENYIFGTASLIFFFLLIQANEKRFSILVPAGLILFGITITNIAQGVIGLFFNKNLSTNQPALTAVLGGQNKIKKFFNQYGFSRLILYSILIFIFGILLTFFTNFIYPKSITLFFNPQDIAVEFGFVKISGAEPQTNLTEKFQVLTRTMALYGMVAPDVLEVISKKPPFPTIDLKTFDIRTHALASYKGLANIPLVLWLILLTGCAFAFIKNIRNSKHLSLMLGLLGALGFNFLMHLFYGTELFLYTPYWMYALVFFMALSLSDYAQKTWLQIILAIIVLVIVINNFNFIFSILKSIEPFYIATP
ncbi:MAG: hypothetical protein UZ14_CFX002000164 [Chloroflexi bacterium OLB14]|nr:MAG: hypothetical protein UZ14_CFX002000164 [Chloroflexi bacterium OLB14]